MADVKTIDNTYEAILKQAVKQPMGWARLKKSYPAYIVLIFMVALSLLVWDFVGQKVHSDQQLTFDKAQNSVMTRLERRLLQVYQVLQSMRGLYDNPSIFQVVRDYFMLYGTVPVKTYPSISSLMYVPKIDKALLEDHIHYTQSQGLYDYKVYPQSDREFYYPVEFIVPDEGNNHISGYDMASDPITLNAINRARDSNIVVATPVFNVRKPDTVGFFIISPVYNKGSEVATVEQRRRSYEGSVVMEMNSKMFFEKAIGGGVPSDTSIVFKIIDYDPDNREQVIYSSYNADILSTGYKSLLIDEKIFRIADREFKVDFWTVPNFGGEFQKFLPLLSFIISIILSVVFFGFILSVTTSKARAVDLAERMTRSQRRIVESSKDIIAVMDLSGKWRSMNPASIELLGYEPEEMIGKKIDPLFVVQSDVETFYEMIKDADDEYTDRVDLQMKWRDSELKWINWSFTVSKSDGLIYCIGRDVTLEKLASEETILKNKQMQLAQQMTREASEFKTFFMTKLSHQLRNSLTGIVGYLQMLSQKMYETEEERTNYLQMAETSSEELFTVVTDMVDVAKGAGGEESKVNLETISIIDAFKETAELLLKRLNIDKKIRIIPMDDGGTTSAVVDKNLFIDAISELYLALTEGVEECDLQVAAVENIQEGATEIQILAGKNDLLSEMIDIYKEHKDSIISALRMDKDDILLHLARTSSDFRMMNGNMAIENLGGDEGNYVQITLPLYQTNQE